MSRIKGKNTKPETRLREALRAAGLSGYRLHWGPYKIDIAFPGRKVAIFVDGCFWHGCPAHCRVPGTNHEFWRGKIKRNMERDREADAALGAAGWKVFRFWEHELGRLTDNDLRALVGIPVGRVE